MKLILGPFFPRTGRGKRRGGGGGLLLHQDNGNRSLLPLRQVFGEQVLYETKVHVDTPHTTDVLEGDIRQVILLRREFRNILTQCEDKTDCKQGNAILNACTL